jgi:hypothetical protein
MQRAGSDAAEAVVPVDDPRSSPVGRTVVAKLPEVVLSPAIHLLDNQRCTQAARSRLPVKKDEDQANSRLCHRRQHVTALALHFVVSALLGLLPHDATAEHVFVKHRGMVSLEGFECWLVTSSVVDTVCYDRHQTYLLIQVRGTFQQHCAIEPQTVSALVAAASVGRFYNTAIKARYDCGEPGR